MKFCFLELPHIYKQSNIFVDGVTGGMYDDSIEKLMYSSFLQILLQGALVGCCGFYGHVLVCKGSAVPSPNWDRGHARKVTFKANSHLIGYETSVFKGKD